MAATKITSLTPISTIDTAVDPLPIVDVSDTSQSASGTTKKVTVDQIESSIFGATGSKAIVVDNVAALKAMTVASVDDGQVFLTRGYYSDNDDGQGTYIYDAGSSTADNGGTVIAPTSGNGRYKLLFDSEINVAQFGALGTWNGSSGSDDTASLTNAFAASSGKLLKFSSNKRYRVTSQIQMTSNSSVDLNGSILEFVISGATFCLLPVNGCSVFNGTIQNTGSSPSGSGQYQSPICIGEYGNGTGYKNITIRNLTIINNRSDGNGIIILGDSSNVLVENIYGPGDSTTGAFIVGHWGGANSPSSGTFHPHNIVIRNVIAGTYSQSSSNIVFLSGCYDVSVDNVVAEEVGESLVTVFCGDYGFYYAPSNVKSLSSSGISVKNCKSLSSVKYGYVLWMKADLAPGTPIYSSSGVSFENCSTKGKNASSFEGFRLDKCKGGLLLNCVATNHSMGVITAESVSSVIIDGGEFFDNFNDGVYISNSTSNPQSLTVRNVKAYGNGVAVGNYAGILINNGDGHIVENNIIGASGESVQLYGIKVGTSATRVVVQNNKCLGLKTAGTSYLIGDSTTWVTKVFKGNSSEAISGGSIFSGPNPIIIDTIDHGSDYPNRISYLLHGSQIPSSGTWSAGDRVINSNPTATNQIEWVCTASGTPGTWRTNIEGSANKLAGYDSSGQLGSLSNYYLSSNTLGLGSSTNFGYIRFTIYGSQSSSSVGGFLIQNSVSGNASSSDGLLVALDSLDAYVYNQEAGPLYFGTSNQTKLTIDASGNVYPTTGSVGMTNGFFYIPTGSGAPSGTPTSVSGRVPMYYDSTNNKFYIYNTAWKSISLT